MPYTVFISDISDKGAPPRSLEFDEHNLSIGRERGNHIVLPIRTISARHARIEETDGEFIVVDLKSTNGTWVNGRRIGVAQILRDGDVVYIGPFSLRFWMGVQH